MAAKAASFGSVYWSLPAKYSRVSFTTVPASRNRAIRFGIAISPLKVSAMLHISPRFAVAPRIATSEYTTINGLITFSENRNSMQRAPYSPHPIVVEKAKQHIYEGDIFQIVLSNRLSAPFKGSLLNTYRILRTMNPSPYMFYFSGTDVEVAGASPETLVKLENGVLHTFPLAGTRPRGKTEEEDKALEADLLIDPKEIAEHNMLVDLGRNDLGKVSRFGTVDVESFHTIERYSHVMHIGSTVRGEIRDGFDALDAIEAVLPAGTLSGAPKLRACQLIAELENNSGASTAGPSATSTSPGIWTPASPSGSPIRRTAGCL